MPMTVQEILDDKVRKGGHTHAVSPDSPVREAVATMVREDIGSVVVRDGGTLVGMLTLREVVQGLDSLGGRLLEARVGDVMNPKPTAVHPEDSADGLRSTMTDLHITHVPVMQGNDVVGVVSFHDIARSAVKDVAFENKLLKQYIKNWPS